MTKRNVVIPFFPGFYESWLSSGIDRAEERLIENYVERQEEDGVPLELRLNASAMADLYYTHMPVRYGDLHRAVAKQWVEGLENYVAGEGNFNLAMEFETMTSPREYNFETDRVFVDMPLAVLEEMYEQVDKEALAREIKEQFTPRSGFIPFYSNDPEDWFAKPLAEWDHNELGLLLSVFLSDRIDMGEMENALVDYMIEYDTLLDQHFDWLKFEAKICEWQDDKQEELGPDYKLTLAPCKHTGDLFKEGRVKDSYFNGDSDG